MYKNPENMDDYPRNFFYQSTRVFKFYGLWHPDRNMKWTKALITLLRFNTFTFFGICLYTSTYSGVPLYLASKDADRLVDSLSYSTAIVTFQIKSLIVTLNEKTIRGYIKQLEDWTYEYRNYENAIQNVRQGLKSYSFIFWMGEFFYAYCIFTYCFYPILSGEGRIIPMETTLTFGVDTHQTPAYELYLTYEFIGIVSNTTMCMAFDMMFCGILAVTSQIFKNFNQALKVDVMEVSEMEMMNEDYWKLKENKFKHYIRQYNEIMNFVNSIENTYVISSLIHFYYNYIVTGVCMYQCSKLSIGSVRSLSMVGGVLANVIQLVAYCHYGQEVVNQNQEFWNILNTSSWNLQSKNLQYMILMSLRRSQRDRYICAGKIMTLSRETMKKTLQGIFTYYMFLMNFTKN